MTTIQEPDRPHPEMRFFSTLDSLRHWFVTSAMTVQDYERRVEELLLADSAAFRGQQGHE